MPFRPLNRTRSRQAADSALNVIEKRDEIRDSLSYQDLLTYGAQAGIDIKGYAAGEASDARYEDLIESGVAGAPDGEVLTATNTESLTTFYEKVRADVFRTALYFTELGSISPRIREKARRFADITTNPNVVPEKPSASRPDMMPAANKYQG